MGNILKTTLLLAAMTALFLVIGDYFGGQQGMVLAFGLAVAMNFISYFFSDKIALAMYGAQQVTRDDLPRVYGIVERITQRMGFPMPKLFVIATDSPQRFRNRPRSLTCFRCSDAWHPGSVGRRRTR